MRAMLIVNPFATSTTEAGRDALRDTLTASLRRPGDAVATSNGFDITVEHTTHRGHAGELAAQARAEGYDVVVVHGGDGSVNEVVNGLLDSPAVPAVGPPSPALAVVPGGSANVFARALGIDPDPLKATGQLVDLLATGQRRRVSLGHTDNRWFLFNAGLGVDARVIKSIEEQRTAGHQATAGRYFWTTVRTFIGAARDTPTLTVRIPDADPVDGVHFAFVSNASPWTYLGTRPIETNPGTNFDNRLGVFASRSMNPVRNLPLARQLLSKRSAPHVRHLLRADDVDAVEITSTEPIDMQMDGEYLGTRTALMVHCRAAAVEVVAPKS
ncbi:MAG: diacylglycerol kinase [Gordonia sp.]|nr:diacylglycerol kinase [Gordonia sp. (in: high G+C Gram-positive bacteria)]